MKDLTKLAKGEICEIRIPGVCCHNPETTVLAHVRMIDISGIGLKSADLLGAHGCYPCHMAVDGHLRTKYTPEELELMHLQGVMRTQAKLIKRGIIHW